MSFTVGLEEETEISDVESDGRVVSKYTQVMIYKDNSPTRLTGATIASNIGILPGSPFSQDTNATCFHMDVKGAPEKTKPPFLAYFVTFNWATNAPLPIMNSTDPTTRRTIWSVHPQIQQRFVTKDGAGKLIVNTAGQPPDGGVPVDVRLGTVQATRNVTAVGYNRNIVMALSGNINSVSWLGGPPGTVQGDVTTVEKYEGAYHFYEENWTFTYDPLGMQPSIVSAGFYQRNAAYNEYGYSGAELQRICEFDLTGEGTPDTNPVMEPEPLDANGFLVPLSARPGGCVFVTPKYFSLFDFNALGL